MLIDETAGIPVIDVCCLALTADSAVTVDVSVNIGSVLIDTDPTNCLISGFGDYFAPSSPGTAILNFTFTMEDDSEVFGSCEIEVIEM